MTVDPHRGYVEHSYYRYWPWVVIVIVVLFAAAIRIRLLEAPLERDEGEYAYAGQLILQGIWPYQAPSLYKYKMPGIYFIYALVLAIFGQTQVGVHTGLLFANIGAIVILFLIARKLFDNVAAVTAAAIYAVLSMNPFVQGVFAHAEHFVVLAALGGILILLGAIEPYRWWKVLLSGLLFGLAFLIRQHGAAFAVLGGLYLLVSQFRCPEVRWSKIVSSFAVFCFGVVAPFVLTCAALLIVGVFDKFWFWTFVYARKYLSMVPFSIGVKSFTERISYIIHSSVLIWILATGGFIGLLWSKKARPRSLFVLTFLIFSFISICPGLYFRPHYFVLLLPATALLAGIAVSSANSAFSNLGLSTLKKVTPALLILLVTLQSMYKQRVFLFQANPEKVTRMTYRVNPFPESLRIAQYIKERTSPDDCIGILGSEPQILFYAQRHSATGYSDTYELMKKHDYALHMQKEMIREIESARPKFLIFVNIPASWLVNKDSKRVIFRWSEQYHKKFYQKVGVIDIIVSLDRTIHTIYRWDEQAVGYSPKSRFWLTVYRRKT